jgi:hypothetical protein
MAHVPASVSLLVSVAGDEVDGAECLGAIPKAVWPGEPTVTVFAQGKPIHVEFATCTIHDHGSLCVETHEPPLIASSQGVRVEGLGIARDTDMYLLCTGRIKADHPERKTVFAGGPIPGTVSFH